MPCIRSTSDIQDHFAEIIDDKLLEAEIQARRRQSATATSGSWKRPDSCWASESSTMDNEIRDEP